MQRSLTDSRAYNSWIAQEATLITILLELAIGDLNLYPERTLEMINQSNMEMLMTDLTVEL